MMFVSVNLLCGRSQTPEKHGGFAPGVMVVYNTCISAGLPDRFDTLIFRVSHAAAVVRSAQLGCTAPAYGSVARGPVTAAADGACLFLGPTTRRGIPAGQLVVVGRATRSFFSAGWTQPGKFEDDDVFLFCHVWAERVSWFEFFGSQTAGVGVGGVVLRGVRQRRDILTARVET